jgi:hypothetical protein
MEALFLANRKIVRKEGTNPNGEAYNLLPTGGSNKFLTTPEGQVLEFDIQNVGNPSLKYIYIGYEHILDRDKDKLNTKKYRFDRYGGFCLNTEYAKYKNFKISLEELLNSKNWFDNNFQYAQLYDFIILERLEFDEPSKYYKQRKYTIIIEDLEIDLFNPDKYPIDTIIVDTSDNQLNSYSGKFFTKNISVVNNEEFRKQYYTKIITMICFRTYYIHSEIFGILAKKDLDTIKQAVYKKEKLNNSSEYDSLFKIDKIIGNILKDWGYVDNVDASFLLEGKSLEYAEAYYNSISSFYSSLKAADKDIYFGYDSKNNPLDFNGKPITKDGVALPNKTIGVATQEEKDKADNERRLNLLLKYLTTEGLGILDYDTRLAIVIDALSTKYLPQDDGAYLTQNNLLKVISSFANSNDADNFLGFLLKKSNGEMLNFQNLYYKINEYYIQINIPLIGIPVGNKELSRKVLVYILYAIWKFSTYNPNHIPSGVIPNQDGLNPNSFFLTSPGREYFEKPNGEPATDKSLEFEAVEIEQDVLFTHYEVDKKFYNEKICIKKYEAKQSTIYQGVESRKDLWYHLFQPILLLGYKKVGDNEKEVFRLPAIPKVPAFMFYYFKEFEEKYKTNALINFGVQVTVDALLLYFTAGTSELAEMRYLKYLSESGKVILNPSAYQNASNVIRLWKIINTTETISFTASTLANFAIYLSSTSTNQIDKEFYERVRNLAFLVMLGTGLGSLYAQTKAVKEAESILAMLSNPNLTIAVSLEAKNFLISLARSEKYLGAMADKIDALLQTYAPGTTNNIKSVLLTFTKEEQLGFYFDFIQMHDVSKWLKMNEKVNNEVIAITNWKKLYNLGASDRTVLDIIISKPKTNSMAKYYGELSFKKELEAFGYERRWDFLNKVENNDIVFNSYKAKPQLLKAWKRFHVEGNTRAVFLELEVAEQVEFLKILGKEDFFSRIKSNPDIIKSWKKYNSEVSFKTYFSKYSDEEVLMFHDEFRSDNILNFNRFLSKPRRLFDQKRYLKKYLPPGEQQRIYKADILSFATIVSNKFGLHGTKLFNKLNAAYDDFELVNSSNSGNWFRQRELLSTFSHKDYPDNMFIRTNILKDDLDDFIRTRGFKKETVTKDNIKEIFDHFENLEADGRSMHPLILERVEFHLEILTLKQAKSDMEQLQKAGGFPGLHGEVRSLNRLLWDLEEKGLVVNDDIFENILGYNIKFRRSQVFPRCYDCCSITRDVKMILLN